MMKRWRIVPLLMVFVALAHFNRVSIAVAGAEQIIRPGFISETEMGFVYSSFLLLYTIFMIPGGFLIDCFGPRAAWMVLAFGATAGVALTGLVGLTFTQAVPLLVGLVVVRSLLGVCNAPLHPSGARLVANWIPPGGVALANGLVTFAACVGMASAYVVFGMLMDRFGWPQAFLVTSGMTFLVALVWSLTASNHPAEVTAPEDSPLISRSILAWFSRSGSTATTRTPVPSPASESPSVEPGRFTKLLWNPSLLCLTLSYGTVGYFQYLFFYWAEFYFEKVLVYPKDVSRRNTSLLTLAMGAGMVLGGWLSDRAMARFGAYRGLAVVPVVGLLLGAAATIVGVFTDSPNVILISFAIAMAAVGSCEGSFWTASVRIGGAQGGTAAAILNTGGNAVGLLAPVATPIIAAHFGWKAGLVLASVVCIGGAALWWGVVEADISTREGIDRKSSVREDDTFSSTL
jgi:MFS transporter, ACS family, D-galactonate transporter